LRRRQFEQDLQDEMAFHLSMREEQLHADGAGDARRDARRRFGSATRVQEDLRDTWAVAPRAGALLADLRYAARGLRRSRGFTTVVVLTLGLGIGANTAFFSAVNAVLIRPLGYGDADRIVALHEAYPKMKIDGLPLDRLPFSPLDFDDLRRVQESFDAVAAYRSSPVEISGDGTPEQIVGTKVSPNIFRVLAVYPTFGRPFGAADERPDADVVILSWSLWQRRYGGDSAILGRRIQLDRRPHTVIGVMPATFMFPRRGTKVIATFSTLPADAWTPLAFTVEEQQQRTSGHVNMVLARLKPDVSFEQAHAELEVVTERVAGNYDPGMREAVGLRIYGVPLREDVAGSIASPLLMLLGAVGLVLLVACANVANLLLSRGVGRTREFAVRAALGAGKAQVIRLLLCEASLVAAAGGLVGLAVAYAALNAAPTVLVETLPELHDLAIDRRVLAFTAALCLGTAIVFSLVPLLVLDRRNPVRALRTESSRATAGPGKFRIQRGLVVLTVGLACVLLVGAGLFLRSFATLLATDVGFRPAQVLTVSMTLPRMTYAAATDVRTFYDAILRDVSALPGVESAALTTDLPFTSYDLNVFTPDAPTTLLLTQRSTVVSYVNGPYFETFGIPIARGRTFRADEHRRDLGVIVVNERLAALAFPGRDPVGRRMKFGDTGSAEPWMTVVGVVANVADAPMGEQANAHAWIPMRQVGDALIDSPASHHFARDLKVALLAEGDPGALGRSVREAIAKLDPSLAVARIETMDDLISEAVAPMRFGTGLVSAFGAMALMLATIGLYGLLSFTTAERAREIAVRMALGAERRRVVQLVLGQGARLVAIGLAVGLASSIGLSRFIASRLYDTSAFDPPTFVAVALVLGLVALTACVLPARRAARVDPMSVLRAE
jgi:putative ABC transport system permease protein